MIQKLIKEYTALLVEKTRSSQSKSSRWESPAFNLKEFKSLKNSEDMIDYASNYLEFLGEGRARSVFVLNSKKVLKIAMNKNGIAQNSKEFIVYNAVGDTGIVTKIYDSDMMGRWIIAELVRPLTSRKEFKASTGLDWYEFAENISNQSEFSLVGADKFTKDVYAAAKAHNLNVNDLNVLDHWGMTPDRRVVMLDYGLQN